MVTKNTNFMFIVVERIHVLSIVYLFVDLQSKKTLLESVIFRGNDICNK